MIKAFSHFFYQEVYATGLVVFYSKTTLFLAVILTQIQRNPECSKMQRMSVIYISNRCIHGSCNTLSSKLIWFLELVIFSGNLLYDIVGLRTSVLSGGVSVFPFRMICLILALEQRPTTISEQMRQ